MIINEIGNKFNINKVTFCINELKKPSHEMSQEKQNRRHNENLSEIDKGK